MVKPKYPVKTHQNLGRFLVDSDASIWLIYETFLAWVLFSFFASFGKETYLQEVQALLQKSAIVYAVCFSLLGMGLGLFEKENRFHKLKSLQLMVTTTLLATPVSLFFIYVFTFEKIGRVSFALGSVGTSMAIYIIVHIFGSFLLKIYPHRFIFLGEVSEVGIRFLNELKSSSAPQFQHAESLAKIVENKLRNPTEKIDFTELVNQLREGGVSVVVYNWKTKGDAIYSDFLLAALSQGLRVVEDVQYFSETVRQVPVTSLSDSYILKMGLDIHSPHQGFAKFLLDTFIAFCFLFTLGIPVFLLISILIKLNSKGPVFYVQKRVGRFGKEFNLYKFRTMEDRCPKLNEENPYFTIKDDPRVTSVGRFLRVLHLDELPQFWNILKGEMSLVGPRPLATSMVDDVASTLPLYKLRHIVRPGLTGLAQIYQGQTSSDKDELAEKLSYDLYYVKNFSIYFDLWIISRTVFSLMKSTW